MSETVEALIKKLKGLPEFVKTAADEAISESKEDIIDLNRAQLQVDGVDNEDLPLGEYSAKSRKIRAEKGLQTSFIDLRFTGEFQRKIVLRKKKKASYEFDSNDKKWDGNVADPLINRFPDALGLTSNNEDKVTKLVTENIEFRVDNYL